MPEWKDTVNLPRTEFPMKASLPRTEPEALARWAAMDLYGQRAVSGIIGCLYTGAGLGTLVGPWLAGAAYDAFGAYDVPIVAGAACSFLAAAAVVPLMRHEKAPLLHRG